MIRRRDSREPTLNLTRRAAAARRRIHDTLSIIKIVCTDISFVHRAWKTPKEGTEIDGGYKTRFNKLETDLYFRRSGQRNDHVAVKYFRLTSDRLSGVHAVCIIYARHMRYLGSYIIFAHI